MYQDCCCLPISRWKITKALTTKSPTKLSVKKIFLFIEQENYSQDPVDLDKSKLKSWSCTQSLFKCYSLITKPTVLGNLSIPAHLYVSAISRWGLKQQALSNFLFLYHVMH